MDFEGYLKKLIGIKQILTLIFVMLNSRELAEIFPDFI